ncbi:hypothetical protein SBOR_8547 [Sclerotinia borealis F-4128]|uniref:JmjC domain-containing protein n=1 Tax=Sclerotinia borealis (strain F-4128) TaxID=1432307 RepID=W9C894_SCLBF|nr:hypothetical protein SBOR_8547 [Sclerotinia borealis F-4128]
MRLRLNSIICQSICTYQFPHSISTRRYHNLPSVPTISCSFDEVNLDEFRQKAFIPMKPVFMRSMNNESSTSPKNDTSISVAAKWFVPVSSTQSANLVPPSETNTLAPSRYLHSFADTILPYELTVDSINMRKQLEWFMQPSKNLVEFSEQLCRSLEPYDSHKTFYHFHAPFSLFLCATHPTCSLPLYIAQAQIADLPSELQEDLPAPKVVKEAGKGDIYDANIWMGTSTSYTPLHKDPNPNLFVQLVSKKKVRLFPPSIGRGIYQNVQQNIGASGIASMRGEEMMEGPERYLLEERVWGEGVTDEGFEAEVGPGDALFIPKGWWHSIKSSESGINASVNWWFR